MARIGCKETPDRLPHGGHDRSFGSERAAIRAYPARQCRRNGQRARGCQGRRRRHLCRDLFGIYLLHPGGPLDLAMAERAQQLVPQIDRGRL